MIEINLDDGTSYMFPKNQFLWCYKRFQFKLHVTNIYTRDHYIFNFTYSKWIDLQHALRDNSDKAYSFFIDN